MGRLPLLPIYPRDFIGLKLRSLLSPHIPSRYYFSLDTPTPTLGEAYFGAGRGYDDFAYVTVSTGIGAGIMSNGKYFTGGMGWAGGVGHIIIDETSERSAKVAEIMAAWRLWLPSRVL
jgi:glucokinase